MKKIFSHEIVVQDGIFLRRHKTKNAKADIWFIHGFGESSLCYTEAFSSPLIQHYNLFAPDLPGFGVSPLRGSSATLQDSTKVMSNLIRQESAGRPLVIIGFSLGGIIATWLSEKFEKQIVALINVEGNLTEADTFFSRFAKDYESPAEFYHAFIKKVFALLGENEALHRYYASVRFAYPQALLDWAKSGVAATGKTTGGEEFAQLKCRKIYLWGEQSSPVETQEFLRLNNVPNHCFKACGHWPMIEQSKEFYDKILKFIEEAVAYPNAALEESMHGDEESQEILVLPAHRDSDVK